MRASKDGYANDAMSWGPQVAPGAKLLLNATGAVNKMATFNTSFVSFRTKMCGMILARFRSQIGGEQHIDTNNQFFPWPAHSEVFGAIDEEICRSSALRTMRTAPHVPPRVDM